MRIRLTKLEIFYSILTIVVCYIALAIVLFLLLAANTSLTVNVYGNVLTFIKENVYNVITVGVSVGVLTAITYCYFYFENKNVLARPAKIIEIYLLLGVALTLCFFVGAYVNVTARPLTLFALLAAMLLRRRDAVFINSVFALTLFIFDKFLLDVNGYAGIENIVSYSNLLSAFCSGIVAIFVMKGVKTRIGSVLVMFVLLIPVLTINLVLQLPNQETINFTNAMHIVLYGSLDCAFSVILFMFLLPVFEFFFSELTPFRLRELTSDNAKIIKRLKANAFGTYNHSIVVAQLAEACASAIGEDSELARAAAYYHDVGKLKNPEMFAENQSEYDMHKELTPELSVDIIRSHARDGAKLIRKNHLPEFFADVAVQHHGTLPIKYFYAKALKMSDGELNADSYSYAGPTPTSKIAAIIMIADASEAATRSLPSRTPENVEALVSGLIEERMNLDQFVDCDITMRELTIITRTIVNSLTGVYHSRVAYPKLTISKRRK